MAATDVNRPDTDFPPQNRRNLMSQSAPISAPAHRPGLIAAPTAAPTAARISAPISVPNFPRLFHRAFTRLPDLRGAALPLAVLLLWWLATHFGWVNIRLIVPPQAVWQVALRTLADPLFYQGVLASLLRDSGGFVLGSIGGIALGVVLGVSRPAARVLGPSFHTLRQISLFAWLPLLSSWLGYGEAAKLVLIGLAALYPVTLGTLEGVRSVPPALHDVARVFCFTRWQMLWRLLLPAAAPQIATGLALGLVYAWLATIGSEFLLANWGNGLGNLIIKGRASFNVALIMFGMLLIGVIGVLQNTLAARIEAYVLRWRGPARA
jgi:sulfonate transport system permease protein